MERGFEQFKVIKVKVASAAGTTAVNSDPVDLQDYDGVVFVTSSGAIVSGGVQSIKVQEGDASDLSDAVDVSGLAITIADTQGSQSFMLDYHRVVKRYARAVISRATQNSTFGEIYAICYGAALKPVVNAVASTMTVANNT